MLAVALLETGKVSLKSVGRVRDALVIEVGEHVWQGFEDHAARSLEIAGDSSTVGGGS